MELGPEEGMNKLRHPDCGFCNEFQLLLRGRDEEIRQLKRKVEKLQKGRPKESIIWRVGHKLGRTLYRKVGEEDSDRDEFLGIMESPGLAAMVVDAVNTEE